MIDHPTELRRICGHDSRSVDGCVTCEAADEIERLTAENEKLRRLLSEWLRENSPGGWIDELRRQLADAIRERDELRRQLADMRATHERDEPGKDQK